MRKQAMLFPYHKEMLQLYKFKHMLDYDIRSVVSFKSWGYVGRNALCFDGVESAEEIVTDDFDGELNHVDLVILGSFAQYYGDPGIRQVYLEKIRKAGKEVLCLDSLRDSEVTEPAFRNNPLPVPVLGIFGVRENCGKLDLQLQIVQALRREGYTVSLLGANPQTTLFGGHVYPDMLYAQSVGELDKVQMIRSLANTAVEQDASDILIFSTPYGVNRTDERMNNLTYENNGLLTQVIIEALQPDATMLCISATDTLTVIERAKRTVEASSGALAIAIAAKRLYRIPLTTHQRFQCGFMTDEMMTESQSWLQEYFHIPILDQDRVKGDELVDLIQQTFRSGNLMEGLI